MNFLTVWLYSTFSCLWNFQICELRLLLVLKSARQKSHLCLIPTIWVSTCILMWLFFLFCLSHPGLEHAHKVWPHSSTILYIIVSSSASNCSGTKRKHYTMQWSRGIVFLWQFGVRWHLIIITNTEKDKQQRNHYLQQQKKKWKRYKYHVTRWELFITSHQQFDVIPSNVIHKM